MVTNYDPRKDPIAPTFERNYYEFFEICMITGQYRQGLKVLRLDEKDLPEYMINKFKKEFEDKIKEGNLAKKLRGR